MGVSQFRVAGRTVSGDDPQFPAMLAALHGGKQRPLCLCSEPNPAMYIAKVGGHYILKRMPNTGPFHSPSCDSYDPPAELSGLGDVLGSAIQENVEDGTTSLKFSFSLSKMPGRAPVIPTGKDSDTAKTTGSKLGLRATLHYLWEQAEFHKWAPSMAGKRTWNVIRKFLLQAAETKFAKGEPLRELLYIPEPFSQEHKNEIMHRRLAHLAKILTSPRTGAQPLMLIVGELKEIAPARYGHKLVVKHLPDCPLMLNDELHARLLRIFESELTLWNAAEGSRLMMIATFGAGPTGVLSAHELALMVVTDHWIPIDNLYEYTLVDRLIRSGRRFLKGLRYNLPSTRPLASAVVSDTQPRPVAIYIIPPAASEEYTASLVELIQESDLPHWCWQAENAEFPALPPRTGYVPNPLPELVPQTATP